MGHKKSAAKVANAIKEATQYRLFTRRLISLSREPAVYLNQPRGLAVPANLGQLRNQQGAGTHQ
jgi:hypothetical protein